MPAAVLSGLLYQRQGLQACLWASAALAVAAGALSLRLPDAARSPGSPAPSGRRPPAPA